MCRPCKPEQQLLRGGPKSTLQSHWFPPASLGAIGTQAIAPSQPLKPQLVRPGWFPFAADAAQVRSRLCGAGALKVAQPSRAPPALSIPGIHEWPAPDGYHARTEAQHLVPVLLEVRGVAAGQATGRSRIQSLQAPGSVTAGLTRVDMSELTRAGHATGWTQGVGVLLMYGIWEMSG